MCTIKKDDRSRGRPFSRYHDFISPFIKKLHRDLISVTIRLCKSKALIEFFCSFISFDITEDDLVISTICFHRIEKHFDRFFPVTSALIPLIYKKLTEIVALHVRQIIVQSHANRRFISANQKGSASLHAVGSGKHNRGIGNITLLRLRNFQPRSPVIGVNVNQLNYTFSHLIHIVSNRISKINIFSKALNRAFQ